jgi:hypothetical protein
MKNSAVRLLAVSVCSAFFFGCAHPYTLSSLSKKPEYLNGIALSTAVTPKCVFQAGYQYSTPEEMLVKVRILNKTKSSFEVDSSAFSMNGPKETVKDLSLPASDPDRYLKDLKDTAKVLDERTHMDSYQGVEELGALKGANADAQIRAAKDAYHRKVEEAKDAREQADAIQKRIAAIEPNVLRKTTVKPGETVEGAILFKAAFGETGVVTIESSLAACPARLRFMLKK